ncbi:MAG: DUF1049 domain-containing protein [Acidimicrobiia bacterium]|nr:DUF1049 domain-containing protein [Acidimicrobiia bacterium]
MSDQPPPPEQQPAPPRESAGLSAAAISFLVVALLLLIFMLENTKEAHVHLFLWHVNLPLWFVIFGSALAGAVLWAGSGALHRHRRRKANKSQVGAGRK